MSIALYKLLKGDPASEASSVLNSLKRVAQILSQAPDVSNLESTSPIFDAETNAIVVFGAACWIVISATSKDENDRVIIVNKVITPMYIMFLIRSLVY
jgi:hypothetical protein